MTKCPMHNQSTPCRICDEEKAQGQSLDSLGQLKPRTHPLTGRLEHRQPEDVDRVELARLKQLQTTVHSGDNSVLTPTAMGSIPEKRNDHWSTPKLLYQELDDEFHFDLDVCAAENNAKCETYFDEKTDALKQRWADHGTTAFMNPPYSKVSEFMRYAVIQSQEILVVCLVPASTDTHWFHNYAMDGEVRFRKGRVQFVNPDTKRASRNGNPKGSCVIVFRPARFVSGVQDRSLRRYQQAIWEPITV